MRVDGICRCDSAHILAFIVSAAQPTFGVFGVCIGGVSLPRNSYLSGYIFPALIAALVPLRTFVVSRMFDEGDLAHLDPMDEAFTPPDSQPHNHDVVEENQSSKGSQASDLHRKVNLQGFSDDRSGQHSDPHKTV